MSCMKNPGASMQSPLVIGIEAVITDEGKMFWWSNEFPYVQLNLPNLVNLV